MERNLAETAFDQYVGIAMSIFSRYPIGTNILERDWDTLILLDTCRVDALQKVAPEYDFINDIGTIISVGSTSSEWMGCTFVDKYRDELEETIYVSANGFDEQILRDGDPPGHDEEEFHGQIGRQLVNMNC